MPDLYIADGRVNGRVAWRCCKCGVVRPKTNDSIGTGYAVNRGTSRFSKNAKVCYECCAKADREALLSTPVGAYCKKVMLYVNGTDRNPRVSNWPGTLQTMIYSAELSRRLSEVGLTPGLFITFWLYEGSTLDGTYKRLGKFTAQLMTHTGNYLSKIRRIK